MSHPRRTGFDKDVRRAIESDPEFAAEYFAELQRRPVPVQLALLRTFLGWTQERLAQAMGMKQTHVSRLERADSDHLLSLYKRAADRLGAHIAIVPAQMEIVPRRRRKRSPAFRKALSRIFSRHDRTFIRPGSSQTQA